jgi:hypothetical protein
MLGTAFLFLLPVLPRAFAQEAPSQWGPWIPIKDGSQDLVSISFKKAQGCNGPTCLYYWRFQNGYPNPAQLDCNLIINDARGHQLKDACAAGKLHPGINTNGGWWTSSADEPKVSFKGLAPGSSREQAPKAGRTATTGSPRATSPQGSTGQGDYRLGAKVPLPDGEHSDLVGFFMYRSDHYDCKGEYAVYGTFYNVGFEIRAGVVTKRRESDHHEHLVRCVTADETKDPTIWAAPEKRFFLRPNTVPMGGPPG